MKTIKDYLANPVKNPNYDAVYANAIGCPTAKSIANTLYTENEVTEIVDRILNLEDSLESLYTRVWGEYSPLTTTGNRLWLVKSTGTKYNPETKQKQTYTTTAIRTGDSKNGELGIPGTKYAAIQSLVMTLMMSFTKDMTFEAPVNSAKEGIKGQQVLDIDWDKLVAKLRGTDKSLFKYTTELVAQSQDCDLRANLYQVEYVTPTDELYSKVAREFLKLTKAEEWTKTEVPMKIGYLSGFWSSEDVHAFLSLLFAQESGLPVLSFPRGWLYVHRSVEAMHNANPERFLISEEILQKAFVYTDLPRYFSHYISGAELLALTKVLELALGEQKGLSVKEDIISFEGEVEITVEADGVYDDEQRRAINSVIYTLGLGNTINLDYVSGFGGVLLSMLNHLDAFEKNKDLTTFKWYRDSLSSAILFDHTVETGAAVQGDRQDYDEFSAKMYKLEHIVPLNTVKSSTGKGYSYVSTASGLQKVGGPEVAELALDILDQTRLVVLPKGDLPLIDGRVIHTKWSDASPIVYNQLAYMHYVIENMCGDDCNWIDELKELYPDYWVMSAYQEEEFLRLVLEYGVLMHSTKNTKLKRPTTTMCIASVPVGKNATLNALKSWRTQEASAIHKVEAILMPFGVYVPGEAILLESLGLPSVRQSSDSHFIESYGVKDENGKLDWAKTVLSFVDVNNQEYPIAYKGGGKYSMDFTTTTKFTCKGEEVETEGVYCVEGDIIATVGYENEEGKLYYYNVVAEKTCFVKQLRWVVKKKLGNAQGSTMKLRVVYNKVIGTSNDIKGRANIKTTFSGIPNGKSCVYNDLNASKKLTKGTVALFPSDTMKYPDLLMNTLDIAALCLRENYGSDAIKHMNSQLFAGSEESESLIWNPLTAASGGYDKLKQWFEYAYAQNLWVEYTDLEDNALATLFELYTNLADKGKQWKYVDASVVKEQTGADFTDKSGVCCLYTTWNGTELEDLEGNKRWVSLSNVLVFYKEINLVTGVIEDHFLQYSLCYAGTEGLKLYQPMKTELGSVRESVCVCNTMATVTAVVAQGVPGIYEPNPKLAAWLGDNTSRIKQWQHIQAMVNKTAILDDNKEALPVVSLTVAKSQQIVVNPALAVLIDGYKASKIAEGEDYVDLALRAADPYEYGVVTFEELAEIFSSVVLDFGVCHIYLPALLRQENEPSGQESLNGLILAVLVSAITGSKALVVSTQSKIKAAIVGLALSSDFLKGISQGQPGLGCKALGIFGIKADEFIILRDNRPDSYYMKMKKLCIKQGIINRGDDIDGVTVMDYRAPIVFVAFKKIRVVEPGSLIGSMINAYQAGVHALASYISAGDHDGDIYYFVPIPEELCGEIQYTTIQIILDMITLRTGIGALVPEQSAYIADHWKIKMPSAGAIKGGLLQKKHFGGYQRFDKVAKPDSTEGLSTKNIALLEASTKVPQGLRTVISEGAIDFSCNVGSMYQLSSRVVLLETILKADYSFIKDSEEITNQTTNSWMGSLSCPAVELYETELGGYQSPTFEACTKLSAIQSGGKIEPDTHTDVSKLIEEGGLNPARALGFISAASYGSYCKMLDEISKDTKQYYCYGSDIKDSATGIIYLLPAILDELLRGKLYRNDSGNVGLPKGKVKREGQIALAKAFYTWLVTYDPSNRLRETSYVVCLCDDLLRGILPCVLNKAQLAEINKVFTGAGTNTAAAPKEGLTLTERMAMKKESEGKAAANTLVSAHTPISDSVYI